MEHHDISLLLRSHAPILILHTHEERRAVNLLKDIAINLAMTVSRWSITTGLQRIDLIMEPQVHLKDPDKVLAHIKGSQFEGIYLLLDFHPYLKDPVRIRLLKELAMSFSHTKSKLVLVSHQIDIPPEIKKMSVSFELELPNEEQLMTLVHEEATMFSKNNSNQRVSADTDILKHFISYLKGLTYNDARHLVRTAIVDDGAITESDLPEVMQAKYKLMNQDDVLSFEYETSHFSELAGMDKLKTWLKQREHFFRQSTEMPGMESPKGILLLGVQGCGKSVAAKAVAGAWKMPLLRLDFGRLYNKYVGETENNIRQALKTASIMSPCVLWIDELEKGIAMNDNDDGTSQRILATLLTWMAENNKQVFIVATSNAIDKLPPELIRKGRLDEIFFVDLPITDVRKNIFQIHANKRALDLKLLDLDKLAEITEGFSGSEIEQVVVSTIYAAHNDKVTVNTKSMIEEIHSTKPLSVVMAEKIGALRHWAKDRTVSVD